MATLQSQVQDLARAFAEQVVGALRTASLGELVSTRSEVSVNTARPLPRHISKATPGAALRTPTGARSNGRLPRRSAEAIQATLDKVVTLVRKHKNGLRAEEIRATLGLLSKEMPRVLKDGISKKKLTTKGQKRATTYFAK